MLVRQTAGSMLAYQYWACDGSCTNAAQWISATVAYAYARPSASSEPFSRYFTLDANGHPRFVYYDEGQNQDDPHRGVYYTGCDSNCTNAANWGKLQLLQDTSAQQLDLAIGSAGQTGIAYLSYDMDNTQWYVAYAECKTGCWTLNNWSNIGLIITVNASVTEWAAYSLRVDSNGLRGWRCTPAQVWVER